MVVSALAGLTSSVRVSGSPPLCEAAFSQLASDREG
jgi:hypothetical protein